MSVLTERDGPLLVVTLNRPDRLNSFSVEMTTKLSEVFAEAETNAGIRAVVVTGAGRGFCAGQDLTERAVAPGGPGQRVDVGASLDRRFNPLIRQMRALKKPIIVAVNGVAAGAGANFALAGDIVLAAKSASFIQAFVKIGLIPDCGGTFHLQHLVGAARARALAMLAEPVSASQAEQWGMIWRAVDDTALIEAAERLAATLATQPTQALVMTRHAIAAAAANSLDAQLDVERDFQRRAGQTPDFAEGVTAFLEKRPPVFTGRAAPAELA
jgi:2-(1,2-epoxy-1,2-dihydrophenyl)acetyl-CoA isomerase